jgi:hypothetical protein
MPRVSAATALLIGVPTVTHAAAYRLAFLTQDFFDATSSSISTYNADVTAEAALNGSLPSASWMALASVVGTSAASNVSCGGTCDTLPMTAPNDKRVDSGIRVSPSCPFPGSLEGLSGPPTEASCRETYLGRARGSHISNL